jgi:D-glycerate 3-kinase
MAKARLKGPKCEATSPQEARPARHKDRAEVQPAARSGEVTPPSSRVADSHDERPSPPAGPPATPVSAERRHLWAQGRPGPDLREGTTEYRLFEGFPAFLASLDLPEFEDDLRHAYQTVHIHTSLTPYFALFDKRNYRFVSLQYTAETIDIAYGLYQAVLDTQDDRQFYMLIVAQLLELLHPGAPRPDITVAPLVRNQSLRAHSGTRGLIATQNDFIEKQLHERQIELALLRFLKVRRMAPADRCLLRDSLLDDVNMAAICHVCAENVDSVLAARLLLLSRVYQGFLNLTENELKIPQSLLYALWHTYIPLSEWTIRRAQARKEAGRDGAYVLGMTGAQGSGKSTINAILTLLFEAQGYRTAGFSLDDLYKTHKERQALRQECEHFRFRGPPGTHDVELGLRVLEDLRESSMGRAARIPVFAKSLHEGDGDRLPRGRWNVIRDRVDIVIFDGWCLGARPVPAAELDSPICDIEESEAYDDVHGTFRRRINRELQRYVPLFDQCDDLIVLHVRNPGNIYRWRQLQERKLKEATGSGMEPATVTTFVDYYLPSTLRYVMPLGEEPTKGASLVLRMGDDRGIREVKRFETPATVRSNARFLTPRAEEDAKKAFRFPRRDIRRDTGTVVLIADGVGLAPLDAENPLSRCNTPNLDMLASPRWSRCLSFLWSTDCPPHPSRTRGFPSLIRDCSTIGTTIHAASEELGLKQGQPGDSAIGHSSLAMGAYVRKYIGVIWDAIKRDTFGTNEAISAPIEHVLNGHDRYAKPRLHIWGMCSPGYIHSDLEILYEILKVCDARGLRGDDVIIHAVTDGKDVPKNTAGIYVRELEEFLAQIGVGVIGTICGRDGWLCNRDRRFLKDRNAPAARCVIEAKGVARDARTALDAIRQGKTSEAGRRYGEDIDRFLEPTHITGVHSQVESGDAMICFNLREDRSVLFPEAFLFPLIDRGNLKDFVYSTLIELRSLAKPHSCHRVAFRQSEQGARCPNYLSGAGLFVRSFAESEKGGEVSKTYVGGDIATTRKEMGSAGVLLEIDPEQYPVSPTRPHDAPEMRCEEVASRIIRGMGEGVAVLANLCNGDVIGHYGDQDATRISMATLDEQIGRVIKAARRKGVILLLTADHGCAETWGPTHSANPVPFFVIFPPQYEDMAGRFVVGSGVKALTDVEPTRFALLGIVQPAHVTGDSIIIPNVSDLSDEQVAYEILSAAARNDFSLLRRCRDKERMRHILGGLMKHRDRQLVRMFVLRLRRRLDELARAHCPFIVEYLERIPPVLLPESGLERRRLEGPLEETRLLGGRREEAGMDSLSFMPRDTARVVFTTEGKPLVLVSLDGLRAAEAEVAQRIGDQLGERWPQGIIARIDVVEDVGSAVESAAGIGAGCILVGGMACGVGDGGGTLNGVLRGLEALRDSARARGIELLIENSSPGDAAGFGDAARIKAIMEHVSGVGLALHIDRAVETARLLGADEASELRRFLEDAVLRSHVRALFMSETDEKAERIVQYCQEQGLDVTIITHPVDAPHPVPEVSGLNRRSRHADTPSARA